MTDKEMTEEEMDRSVPDNGGGQMNDYSPTGGKGGGSRDEVYTVSWYWRFKHIHYRHSS